MEPKLKQTKYAIYYVTVGSAAFDCLKLSLQSVRAAGYSGDIYILTTEKDAQHAANISHLVTDCIYLSEHDLNLDKKSSAPLATFDIRRLQLNNPRNRRMADKFTICHAKALADTHLPWQSYDYFLYLDSDVLMNKPWSKLKTFLAKQKVQIITATNRTRWLGEYPFFLSPLWIKFGTLTSNLRWYELLRFWHTQPLCADVIGFPTDSLGAEFVSTWRYECQKGIDSDQAALQAVLLRKFKKHHHLAAKSIFGYGPSAQEFQKTQKVEYVDSMLVHFHSAVRDNTAMKTYYEKYLAQTVLAK